MPVLVATARLRAERGARRARRRARWRRARASARRYARRRLGCVLVPWPGCGRGRPWWVGAVPPLWGPRRPCVARACLRVHAWAFLLRPPRWLSKGRALLRPECALRACECAVRARRVQNGETLGVLATAAMAQVIGDMGKRKRGIPAVAVLDGWRCRGESRPCRCSQCRAGIPSRGRGRSRRGDFLCSGGLGSSMARSPPSSSRSFLAEPGGWRLSRGVVAEWLGRGRAREAGFYSQTRPWRRGGRWEGNQDTRRA